MTGILGVSLQPEHILFHFPFLVSFLPVGNFSNPFSPLEKGTGQHDKEKEKGKNCNLTTLYLFQR